MMNWLRTLPQYLLPQTLLTQLAGKFADLPVAQQMLIRRFIRHYQVDMDEAEYADPIHYKTFNHFFTRRLKPFARSIATDPLSIACPVDGSVSQYGSINDQTLIQAKGKTYSVEALLGGDPDGAQAFADGEFITLYLSPKDYHRIHMPLDGILKKMIYIPGKLFSVKPLTAAMVPNLFARNERLVIHFDTAFGPLAVVMVGAMIVASLNTVWEGPIGRHKQLKQWHYPNARCLNTTFHKGDELGFFQLGSTVILLFNGQQPLLWQPSLQAGSSVKMGQPLATFNGVRSERRER